jgi:regulator of RNase E activity RraB
MDKRVIRNFLSLPEKVGKKSPRYQPVEFFFYANSEERAANLAIDLARTGYEIYPIHHSGDKWAIVGCTSFIPINEDDLTDWAGTMCALATKHGVEFDGWGMLMP